MLCDNNNTNTNAQKGAQRISVATAIFIPDTIILSSLDGGATSWRILAIETSGRVLPDATQPLLGADLSVGLPCEVPI